MVSGEQQNGLGNLGGLSLGFYKLVQVRISWCYGMRFSTKCVMIGKKSRYF
jgi:hypothetical protein